MATEFEDLLKEMPRIAKAIEHFSSEAVQNQAYETLIAALLGDKLTSKARVLEGKGPKIRRKKVKQEPGSDKEPAKGRNRSQDTYVVVPDLNLRPKSGSSLRDFIASKSPKTNEERFATMIYFLEKKLGIKNIGPNHVYTCFKEISVKVPAKLRIVLGNAARRKSWFSPTVDDLKMTTHGENFVEHDLPHDKD